MPTVTDHLATLHCVSCGVRFAIPAQMLLHRSRDRKHVHCPNGHHNVWPNGVTYEELDEQVDKLKQRIAELTHLLDQAEARRDDDRPVVIQQAPLPSPKEGLPRFGTTCICVECGERKPKKGARRARLVSDTHDRGMICQNCLSKVRS